MTSGEIHDKTTVHLKREQFQDTEEHVSTQSNSTISVICECMYADIHRMSFGKKHKSTE